MKQRQNLKSFDLIAEHPRLRVVAKVMIGIFLCLIVGLAFLPWQQTISGQGKVVALSPNDREQNIIAPISGRLDKWYVHDGSHVNANDPIVALSDNDPELLKRLANEKKAVLLRINTSKIAIDNARNNVRRQKRLYDEGISSRRKYEVAQFEYLKYKNEVAKANIQLTNINTRIARQQNQLVKAPIAGTIIRRISGQASVLVKQGERLAVLVPDTKSRAVALWLNGNDVPLVKKGQKVRLQFEGWPAIQFSGWPSVAVGTFGGHVAFVDPIDNGKGKFRIVIVPDKNSHWPDSKFLRQGVRVNGWVLLSQVRLWYELWRRSNGFPPALQSKPEDDE